MSFPLPYAPEGGIDRQSITVLSAGHGPFKGHFLSHNLTRNNALIKPPWA
jgi:hypothetical protein